MRLPPAPAMILYPRTDPYTHFEPILLVRVGQRRPHRHQLNPDHIRIRLPDVPPRIRLHLRQELLPRGSLDMIQYLERPDPRIHS